MEIIKFLQSFSHPFMDYLFQAITMLGEETIYVGAIVILYWCFNKRTAVRFAFIQIFSMVINGAIKDTVRAPRPIGTEGIFSLRVETATGYSFPSGHTQGTATFWVTLMKVCKKSWLYILGPIVIFLVALSRLYLGVHWPKDVAAGIILGIICVFIADKIMDLTYKKDNHRYMLILVVPALLGLILFPSKDYVKAVATVTGLYIGYVLENKYIAFKTKSPISKQALKIIVGFLGLAVLKLSVKYLLPDNNFEAFTDYFLLGVWIIAGAPYLFVKLGLSESEVSKKTKSNIGS
ncbi:phosphatase PAP2 family protein [Clostridium thermarum]|uniref:phosphatase PAP2 family protein n=1 Tax=Clostridium thermarum TaxID=1716543 RepID=UPI0013D3F606|nr:phosphatase PAP2 family protein [Clostridium thermarum]